MKPASPAVMDIPNEEEGLTMRRASSDTGSGVGVGVATVANGKPLMSSHSFPSLSDHVLKQLGLWMGENNVERSDAPSTDKEIENKFTSLILAFKTDKITLKSRLELQSRLRDQSEQNMTMEVSRLRDAVQALSPLCTDSEKIELLENIQEQVEALYKSTIRVSSSAELFGAVQQENRLAKAVDIILHHVENLKQAYEKERTEHEEARRVLMENKILPNSVVKLQNSKRRASIATLHRAQLSLDSNKSPTSSGDGRTGRSRLGSLPRRLSNTIPEAETEDKDIHHLNHGKDMLPHTDHLQDSDNHSVMGMVSSSPTATRSSASLSRKSSAVTDNHSNHGDSETEEEESLHDTSDNDQLPSIVKVGNASTFINQRLGGAGSIPWLTKLNVGFDWVQPVDQLLLQIRYCIAVMLLIAAVGVFSSTFFLPHGV